MKNKILLEEISRIQELIGKPLLTEQWTAIAKAISTMSDEFAELVAKYADDFAKLAKATSDDEAIKVLAKLSNAERKFADEIIPRVMEALPDAVKKEVSSITQMAETQLKGGVPRERVNKMVEKRLAAIEVQFDGVKDVMRKNIKDVLDGHVFPTPKPPLPEPPTPGPIDQTLKQKIKNTFAAWDEIVPGGISIKDKLLLNDLWFRGLRAKINYILNGLMNKIAAGEQKSLEKIVSLLKQASNLAENAEDKKIIWKTIDSEIEALRKNEDFTKDVVYKTISDELDKKLGSGKGYEFVNKLKANDPMGEKAQSYFKHLMDETYVGKMFSKAKSKSDWWQNFAERTAMTLTTGNPRKLSEIFQEFIYKYGPVKGFGVWYLYMWAIHRTFIPAFLAFLDTLYVGFVEQTGDKSYDGFWSAYGHFIKERFYDMFSKWQLSFDEVAKKQVPKREFSFIKSVNAIDWLWDDVKNIADWHVAGNTRKLLDKLLDRGKQEAERVGINTQNVAGGFLGYKNNLNSFIDFGHDAGYTVEETDSFSYDPNTKIGITSDNRKYQFTPDSGKENEQDPTGSFQKIQ